MASATRDVIGFRRIFVLFCALVLTPAILLSGLGVVAAMNVRKAQMQTRRNEAQRALRGAQSELAGVFAATDDALNALADTDDIRRTALDLRRNQIPVGALVLLRPDGSVAYAEAPWDTPAFAEPRQQMVDLPPGAHHLQVASLDTRAHVVAGRSPAGTAIGFLVDDERLQRRFSASEDGIQLSLKVPGDSGATLMGPIDRLMRGVLPRADLEEAELFVTAQMPAPFDRYTLQGQVPPPSGALTIWLVILLVLFNAVLITGVVLTSRLIWKETQISRLKTDFVSHISHELRTPLTSIRMFIETLRLNRVSSEDERKECLDLLSRETERLSEMIERVLGYARLQAGRREFDRHPVSPSAIVDDALEAFRVHTLGTEREAAHITRDVAQELPLVRVDKKALVEAVLNLLGNAYKYGGPSKEISVFARTGRRDRIVIGVQDNGPGLPKSEHARVFDRFYRAQDLLSRKEQGTGLGLAITRGIVEGNDGRITVDSEPGHGSTFLIELKSAGAQEAA